MTKIKKNKCPSCDGFKSLSAQRCRDCFAVDRSVYSHTWITRDEEFKTKLREVVRQLAKNYGDKALVETLK
tara:strand:+ start:433 stop:645 length:213 start_codon:yes stop_codon:yes gene_type:complete